MSPPKHIWSGHWQEESEEEARRRQEAEAARRDQAAAAPAAAPGDDRSDAEPSRGTSRGRLGLVAAIIAVLVGGAAFAAGALLQGGGNNDGTTHPTALPAVISKPITPSRGQTRAGAIYAQASPAVVSIRTGTGSGTGFLIDNKGTLVTNDHVVETDPTVSVRFGTDGRTLQGKVIGTDPSSDLAVVHIDPSGVPQGVKPLQFADSGGVAVGDVAIAIGNPFGLDRTVTEGIVSSLGRTLQAPNHYQIDDVIQTDAAINPGNSGGPLLDDGGKVIGVTSQIATSAGGSGNVGIGFAVPSNTVRQVLPGLEQGRTVSHAWLGVEISPVLTSSPSATGAQISGVTAGGPAESAGLQVGDVVTQIDGKAIADPTALSTVINSKGPGDHIELTVKRQSGQTQKVGVTLAPRPAKTP
jgi:putative serine protease PepD